MIINHLQIIKPSPPWSLTEPQVSDECETSGVGLSKFSWKFKMEMKIRVQPKMMEPIYEMPSNH